MRRDKARMAVYALAGVYLLYLVWEIYKGLPTAGTEKPLMIVFMVLFAVVGIAAVGNGVYSVWKQAKELSEAAANPVVEAASDEEEVVSAEQILEESEGLSEEEEE